MADDIKTTRWKTLLTVLTIAALGAMVFALRRQLLETLHNLKTVNIGALFLMLPLQLINYHAYTRMYQRLFRILGHRLKYKDLFKIQLELNFVNNVFPSGGVSGVSYFSVRLLSKNISPGRSTMVQVMKFALIFISFQILISLGLLCLAVVGKTSNLTMLVGGSLATFLLMITFLMAYIISSRQRINGFFTYLSRTANRVISVVRPKNPETININKVREIFTDLHENYNLLKQNWRQLKLPLCYALLANVSEILTIYVVYLAFGNLVNLGAVILAYAIANLAGLVSVLPGGVGIYEAIMTAVLATAGVSPALSLPVTVMYRVLNMTIQLPPGYYFYHRSLHTKPEARLEAHV